MASWIEMQCEEKKCKEVFDFDKGSILNDTPKDVECPKCGSKKTRRIYGIAATDVAEGLCGNASSGYSNNFADHHSGLSGRVRGTRVR